MRCLRSIWRCSARSSTADRGKSGIIKAFGSHSGGSDDSLICMTPETAPQPASGTKALGRTAARGVAWAMLTTVVSKLASLGSQVALGWMLTKEDFGVYASAMAVASMVLIFRDGGAAKLLVQKGSDYTGLARPILAISMMFNVGAATLMVAASPIAGWAYGDARVALLLWIMAASLAISSPPMVGRAKLVSDLRFRDVAKVSTTVVLVKYGLVVAFAALGLGPVSFVLPLIIVEVVDWVMCRSMAGPLPPRSVSRPLTGALFAEVFRDAKWIILSALAAAFLMNGDYLVLGLMTDQRTLGIYFFGFQLTTAVSVLFTSSMQQTLMPAFVKLKEDPQRLGRAYATSIWLLTLVAAPMCVAAALAVPAAIELVWQGKWRDASVVSQVMLLALLTRLMSPLSRALLEALGRWRLQAVSILIDGLGMMAVTGAATWLAEGDIPRIAITIAAYRLAGGLVHAWIAARASGLSTSAFAESLRALPIAAGLGLLCWAAGEFLDADRHWPMVDRSLGSASAFAALFGVFALIRWRGEYHALYLRFRSRDRRAAPPVSGDAD